MLFAVDADELIHLPTGPDRMILAAHGVEIGRAYTTECGASGPGMLYAAEEYVLDDDWCRECAAAVAAERDFLAVLKDPATMRDALGGFTSPIPVRIVPSRRSRSRDKI
jgi:hypothetical protein